jgi:hypothetical protein
LKGRLREFGEFQVEFDGFQVNFGGFSLNFLESWGYSLKLIEKFKRQLFRLEL